MDASFQNGIKSFKVSCSRLKIFRVRWRFSQYYILYYIPETRIYTFSRKFQPKWNATKIDKIFSGRRSANQIFQFGRCLFFINRNVFRHLKLEIALAIPAINEWKIIWNNYSAGQALTLILFKQAKSNYLVILKQHNIKKHCRWNYSFPDRKHLKSSLLLKTAPQRQEQIMKLCLHLI